MIGYLLIVSDVSAVAFGVAAHFAARVPELPPEK